MTKVIHLTNKEYQSIGSLRHCGHDGFIGNVMGYPNGLYLVTFDGLVSAEDLSHTWSFNNSSEGRVRVEYFVDVEMHYKRAE